LDSGQSLVPGPPARITGCSVILLNQFLNTDYLITSDSRQQSFKVLELSMPIISRLCLKGQYHVGLSALFRSFVTVYLDN